MTYYFIRYDQERFGQIRERIGFLSNAASIDDEASLREELASAQDPVFFISLVGSDKKEENLAFHIRDLGTSAKIIYVTDSLGPQELKVHQKSPIGGDAYVKRTVAEDFLRNLVQSFFPDATSIARPFTPETEVNLSQDFSDTSALQEMKSNPMSQEMDALFDSTLGGKSLLKEAAPVAPSKSDELSLDDLGSLEESVEGPQNEMTHDVGGLEIDLSTDMGLELGDAAPEEHAFAEADELDLSLTGIGTPNGDEEEAGTVVKENILDELDVSFDPLHSLEGESQGEAQDTDDLSDLHMDFDNDNLGDDVLSLEATNVQNMDMENLNQDEVHLEVPDASETHAMDGLNLDEVDIGFSANEELGSEEGTRFLKPDDSGDLSDDVKSKLREIDEIMDLDASQVTIVALNKLTGAKPGPESKIVLSEDDLDEPLVSDDINLDHLNFSSEDQTRVEEEKPKKKKKEIPPPPVSSRHLGEDLKEISAAYSGELERTQATIANLRADREELLRKIQRLEDDRVLQNRQSLSTRAELDEKKIELAIIRKKLHEEISELKDRLKLHDERRLILEEKNRVLTLELDKAGQKNKIDIKKVLMRERELEQKLELLKADAETQIRNRDLKILELKRKIDAMEFDMESISEQEKKSVESRFELEDKLEKAIKTLRSAITVLEDETERNHALEVLKKNIDM